MRLLIYLAIGLIILVTIVMAQGIVSPSNNFDDDPETQVIISASDVSHDTKLNPEGSTNDKTLLQKTPAEYMSNPVPASPSGEGEIE